MCDFDRFDKVFGAITTSKTPTSTRKRKKPENRNTKFLKKTKQNAEVKKSDFMLDLTVRKNKNDESSKSFISPRTSNNLFKSQSRVTVSQSLFNSPRVEDSPEIESPDKESILQHISCNIEDFREEIKKPNVFSDDSEEL